MYKDKPRVWVLVDDRTGNANQAIALAEKLELTFEIKHVKYNFLGKLPNFLLCFFPVHVKYSFLRNIKNSSIPDIIISSGRRTAVLALYLKKLSRSKSKIVQIMRPNLPPKDFDLIILPHHDKYSDKFVNVVRIIGALTNIRGRIANEAIGFSQKYPDLKNFVAVLVGGSSKNYQFTLDDAKRLVKILTSIKNNQSASLFITFSRRTPQEVKDYFQDSFTEYDICHDPESNKDNPYPGMLSNAQFIITTSDSISMCSEAASSGKALYIFRPDNFKTKKHNFCIQQLIDLGIARYLGDNTTYLEHYEFQPLSEIERVADIIHKNML